MNGTPQGVAVHYPEGTVHGFLELTTTEGRRLATGDLLQTTDGRRVTGRLVFRFLDGSTIDERTVFTQNRVFHMVSHHLVQRGPAFPDPIDLSIDGATGRVIVKTEDKGKPKVYEKTFELPANLANGLLPTMMKNVRAGAAPPELALIVATPSPRMVTLEISAAPDVSFRFGAGSRKAAHYVVTVHIGGLTGVMAGLLGKTPPDSHIWISRGEVPAFLKAEQPFFAEAPLWRVSLMSPTWPER
jgi:hypothetical protein